MIRRAARVAVFAARSRVQLMRAVVSPTGAYTALISHFLSREVDKAKIVRRVKLRHLLGSGGPLAELFVRLAAAAVR